MIRHSARLLVEIVIGVVAGLLILTGIGIWRLSSGPAQLDFLTPRLEAAFNESSEGLTLHIGRTVLTWEGWGRTVDLRTQQTVVVDSDGSTLAILPDVSITLSLRALVQGVIAPTAVEIIRPSLALIRRADGEIVFRHGAQDDSETPTLAQRDLSRLLPAVVEQLLSVPDPSRPLAFLTTVRLFDGDLTIRDETRGLNWRAEAVTIEARSDADGLAGDGEMELAHEGSPAAVKIAFLYDKDSQKVDLAGSFAELQPDVFEALVPDSEVLSGFDVALNGKLNSRLALDGTIESVSFELGGGPGQIVLADYFPEPLALQDLIVRGNYVGAITGLTIDAAEIRFGSIERPGPTLGAAGRAQWFGNDLQLTTQMRASSLPVDQLADYWPIGLSDNARDWVTENIKRGTADETVLNLDLSVPDGDFDAVEVGTLGGTIRYSNLDVHFLRPMPPVTAVSGTAIYDHTGMSFRVSSGKLDELDVLETNVSITGLEEADEHIDINVPVTGPLRDMLQLLNHERLRLVEPVGLDPEMTEGLAAARVNFQFPLIAALTLDDIDVAGRANLTGVAVEDLLLGQDGRDGKLSLDLTKDAMQIQGRLRFGPLPIQLDWTENFTGNTERRLIKAEARSVNERQREILGFDVWPELTGPVAASVVAQIGRDDSALVQLALNLQDAALGASFLGWRKPDGAPGEARATLALQGDRLVGLEALEIETESLSLSGRGRFDAEGERLTSLFLQRLAYGHTAIAQVQVELAEQRYDIVIGSGDLDTEPLLGKSESDQAAPGAEAANGTAGSPAPEDEERIEPSIRLRAPSLSRLRFDEGRYLEAVALDLERGPDGWQRLRLRGALPESLRTQAEATAETEAAQEASDQLDPRQISIDYGPSRPGLHRLEVLAGDLGGFLRAFDILDTVRGGTLVVTGEEPTGEPLKARAESKDFTVVEAPTLARLLLVASLTGVVEGLRGEGIEFQRLVGEVEVQDGIITSDLVRAYGTSIGITAKGQLDTNEQTVDIEGTIVPAYLLNRIIGEIPVLGPLLTGGEGQGFVAFTYSMEGALPEPEVSVNPLSALAPGFLRSLFGGEFSDGKPVDLPAGANR